MAIPFISEPPKTFTHYTLYQPMTTQSLHDHSRPTWFNPEPQHCSKPMQSYPSHSTSIPVTPDHYPSLQTNPGPLKAYLTTPDQLCPIKDHQHCSKTTQSYIGHSIHIPITPDHYPSLQIYPGVSKAYQTTPDLLKLLQTDCDHSGTTNTAPCPFRPILTTPCICQPSPITSDPPWRTKSLPDPL